MHGFTIKVVNAEGKPETVLFSSVRKTPALLGVLKQIGAKQRMFDRLVTLRRTMKNRVDALSSLGPMVGDADAYVDDTEYVKIQTKLSTAIDELEKNNDAVDELNQALCDLMWEFYLAGFVGAGYPQEKAEQLAALCDPADFPGLRDRAMTGCGAVDFTKRDTP